MRSSFSVSARVAVLLGASLLLFDATWAHPRQQGAELEFEEDARVLGPGLFAGRSGTFGRSTVGEFTGDARPDVVLSFGQDLILVYGPGLYHALGDTSITANDLATLPDALGPGLDALVTVSARGLEQWSYDPATRSFGGVPRGDSSWDGAQRVWIGDADALGGDDVVGLAADGRTFLWLFDVGGGSTQGSFTNSEIVHDFVVLDWDGVSGRETAFVSDSGVWVLAADGTKTLVRSGAGSSDRLCSIEDDVLGNDRLVLATASAAGSIGHRLEVIDQGGIEAALDLGGADVVALASGDFNKDGLGDLALSQSATHELLLLRNTGAGTTFEMTPNNHLRLGSGGTTTTNLAEPAIGNFDGDADLDIVFPLQDESTVVFHRNWQRDHEKLLTQVVGGTYDVSGGQSGVLTLFIDGPEVMPSGANCLELVVWHQDQPSSPTDPVALSREMLVLGAGGSGGFGGQMTWTTELQAPLGASILHDIEVRLVERDATSGAILQAAPTEVWSFGTDSDALEEIGTNHGVPYSALVPIFPPGQGSGPGVQPPGGVGTIPLGCVPCFDEIPIPEPEP